MTNEINAGINIINANTFQSTKESREALLSKLNMKEQKMFKDFVKSLSKQ